MDEQEQPLDDEELLNQLIENYEQGIEHYGTPVRMGTSECMIHRMEHMNKCDRCEFSLGCVKLVLLSRIMARPYPVNSEMEVRILQVKIENDAQIILNAKEIKELAPYIPLLALK